MPQAMKAVPLEELHDRFVRLCFTLTYRMLDQPNVAEPATHEAYMTLSAWPIVCRDSHPADSPAEEGSFPCWLLSVTHNRCLAELRLLRIRHPEVALEATERSVAGNLTDIMVDAAFSSADWKLLTAGRPPLQEVVGQLEPAQRQVLELAYFRGLALAEIAVEMRQPLSTVRSRTRVALGKLLALII